MWWAGPVEKFVQVIQDRWRASIHSWTQTLNRESQRRWRSRCRWNQFLNSWSLQCGVLKDPLSNGTF
jgi:hypothetical protein